MCTYKDICFICIFQNLEKKNLGRFLASKNVNLNFSQTLCRFVTILNPSWCRCYVFRFLRGYMINKQWESGILINVPTSPLSQPAPLSPILPPFVIVMSFLVLILLCNMTITQNYYRLIVVCTKYYFQLTVPPIML